MKYKKVFFLLIVIGLYEIINTTKSYSLEFKEVIYNGECIKGGSLKGNVELFHSLKAKGIQLAKIYKINLTFTEDNLKYCNLEEAYLTHNPFTQEKLIRKLPIMSIHFLTTPYNPKYIPQSISLRSGGNVPIQCILFQIKDIKISDISKRFVQVIVNNETGKHGKDSTENRTKICK